MLIDFTYFTIVEYLLIFYSLFLVKLLIICFPLRKYYKKDHLNFKVAHFKE